jgi:hypothetical protein
MADPVREAAAVGARVSGHGQRRCPIPEMPVSGVGRSRARQMRRDAGPVNLLSASVSTR